MLLRQLAYAFLQGRFAICQLPTGSAIPDWATRGSFVSIFRTEEELSIVCDAIAVPADVKHEAPFVCLKLQGPFPLNETGVLSSFITPLADAGVPVFAMATYNTDYVLIPEGSLRRAEEALQAAGHKMQNAPSLDSG
jgi:hypothetical protein